MKKRAPTLLRFFPRFRDFLLCSIVVSVVLAVFAFCVISFLPVVTRESRLEISNGDGAVRFCKKVNSSDSFRFKAGLCAYARFGAFLGQVYFPGIHDLKAGMAMRDVLKSLRVVQLHKVLIPEGLTVHEIAELLTSDPCLIGAFPENVQEGSLMPDTYVFTCGTRIGVVVNTMRDSMSSFMAQVWPERDRRIDRFIDGPYKATVVASLIEKEAANSEERPIVSSVIFNRLSKGMRLQFCTTLLYALTGGKGQAKFQRHITNKDINSDSPYNTYRLRGLPPGPIANPGRESILAALHPADTEYLFFVSDGNGSHVFSKEFRDHVNRKNRTKEYRLSQYRR